MISLNPFPNSYFEHPTEEIMRLAFKNIPDKEQKIADLKQIWKVMHEGDGAEQRRLFDYAAVHYAAQRNDSFRYHTYVMKKKVRQCCSSTLVPVITLLVLGIFWGMNVMSCSMGNSCSRQ